MRRAGGYSILLAAVSVAAAGCLKQKDLVEPLPTTLHIISPWEPPLGDEFMLNATMMLYGEDGIRKEFFQREDGIDTAVTPGRYSVLVFNGVMESEDVTNLDFVFFRGTNRLDTWEAYVAESNVLRMSRAEGEYVAANNMSLFAFDRGDIYIEHRGGYMTAYQNGSRVDNDGMIYEREVNANLKPRLYSFYFRVRLTGIVNLRSASYAVASVKGFAGSVLPAGTEAGFPVMGFPVTHQMGLGTPADNGNGNGNGNGSSRTSAEDDGVTYGTVESPWFTSFGPRVPVDGRASMEGEGYWLKPVFLLADGTTWSPPEPIDITAQVVEIAATIEAHHRGGEEIDWQGAHFTIEAADRITLPVVEGGDGPGKVDETVGVDDWGADNGGEIGIEI